MNILILNYEYPPLGGGAGIVTQHLAVEFIRKGHQVTVLTTWFPGEPEFYVENNLTVIRLTAKRKHAFQSNPMEMYDWMKKSRHFSGHHFHTGQFDICLANFTLPGGAVADFIRRKLKVSYVILSHGHDIPWFSPRQMFFWHLLCYGYIKYLMKKAAAVVLLTDQLKRNADGFTGVKYAGKNKVIPNGMLSFDIRKGFDAQDKRINALFVGRLVEQKDPMTVIMAFEELLKRNIPIHLKIIGDGVLKRQLEDYISANRLINVELLGKVSQSKVMEEYTKAHILLAPSREEAMSLCVLESISCGVYVFASEVSGNRELILEDVNGNIVEYGNARQIADKVTDFYQHKFLKNYQYPELMMQFMRQNYSWENTACKYLKLFNEVTGTTTR